MNFLIIDACFLDSIITDHIKIDSARELSNAKNDVNLSNGQDRSIRGLQ